ncbi:hypothetical protein JCM9140_3305 [Halalkalibacter wakoensis JCM 9140]|uniref:Ketopantoate reductase N-terminal domain-containing protein n=1 Tax=Halalkalibacter wakoensis JCM 9140 TaxID=1236970 RepID=W4Q724_9BACI|nr:2-dehydropantoate 2-reductase N-terminal domain-containing protein [Halalkalibacter wakoensis]GAE27184.1 hypothetical protein JCM9140_3305 [Halalkalibacter wakoensis JCM 9140]
MKIIIVGAGAVGGFIGGLLQQAGNDVTFLARGRHLEKMKENGLTVNHEDETIKVSGNFSDDFSTVAGAIC